MKEPLTGSDGCDEFDATQEFRLILLGLGNVDIFQAEFIADEGAERCKTKGSIDDPVVLAAFQKAV